MRELVVAHGIRFVRSGRCRQCGACGCGDEPCPHLFEARGKVWCEVYNRREEFCAECGTDHASCIGFPDNPWIHVVRSGVCGFSFERADGGSMDELPFLDGQGYVTK